jgi:hypothetical protein
MAKMAKTWQAAGPGLLRCALGAAALVALCGAAAVAQEDRPKILISYDLKERPADLKIASLRPNVTQPVYVHVQNTAAVKRAMTAKLLHTPKTGAAPVTVATADLGQVDAGATRLVTEWKVTPPASTPPAPAPAPGTPPAPPAPVAIPLGGPPFALQVQVTAGTVTETKDLALRLMVPTEYVAVSDIKYTSDESGKENALRVQVKALEGFTGPPCVVSLDLRPAVIPGLRAEQTNGTYEQKLTAQGTVQLSAENLKFQDAPPKSGLVFLTVDGYERAFIYETTFAALGRTVTPAPDKRPQMRLVADRYVRPSPKLKVGVEVDNPPGLGGLLQVGLDRDRDNVVRGAEFEDRRGAREQRVRVLEPAPDGALLLQTEVKPWTVELDSAGLFGEFLIQGRLEDAGKEVIKAEVRVTFDGTPPENVKIVAGDLPKQLRRGDPIPLKATGNDPQSGISEVVFFAGKLPADGKIPPTAVQVKGTPPAGKETAWTARLPVPTDTKGTAEVSVQFTNRVGLSATDTITIQLVDAPPPSKTTSIEGTIRVGDLAQPNLTVYLRDPQGVEKDKTTTDAAGKYLFKDVPPGSYRVTASKAAGSKGETAVTVTEGQKKTGVDVLLTR